MIISTILRVSLIALLLSPSQSHQGYFMTRFPEIHSFFIFRLQFEADDRLEKNLFQNLSREQIRQECSKLFKTRVFVETDTDPEIISIIKEQINKESEYDFRKMPNRVGNFTIQSYNCFSSKDFSFSFSFNYEYANNQNSYYPLFALYTTKSNNLTEVFAYIERNPILLETNVKKMERELYENIKDHIWFYDTILENDLKYDDHMLFSFFYLRLLKLCNSAVKYVLPEETSEMEVYEMKAHIDPDYKVERILLKSINVDYDYYIYEPVLHCSMTDGNRQQTEFYMMLQPIDDHSVYIIEKTENIFRLNKQLEKIERNEYGFDDTDEDADENTDEDTDENTDEGTDEDMDDEVIDQ